MTQGNYTNSKRVAVNGIDYGHLASIAESSRVPFHILCQRAEKGLPIRDMAPADDNWVDYTTAAEILDTAYGSLASTITSKHCQLEYYGIQWMSRSRVNSKSKRGCGVLFKRADLVAVRKIKQEVHLGLTAALKVFQAIQMGRI